MEFYAAKFGINLKTNVVSIPNGMEFYLKKLTLTERELLVSIPNGMEFYGINYKAALNIVICVSIPNGMEFYQAKQLANRTGYRFNSQRDGILPSQEAG